MLQQDLGTHLGRQMSIIASILEPVILFFGADTAEVFLCYFVCKERPEETEECCASVSTRDLGQLMVLSFSQSLWICLHR